jgi:apolipoprotein N-acyltransferase
VDTYDKVHLVPFGEYLPLRRVFDSLGLRQFVHVPGGFEPGALRQALRAPGFPLAAPLICYEAIFPGAVTPPAPSERPAVLLNVTNDGWFGDTPGPRQHFAQARLRAIEEGLPLVRAANTGVSAVVDAYGRVLELLPVGVEGVIDAPLPLPAEPTVFSRHPFLAPFALWALTLGLALWIRRPGPRRRHG